MIRRLKHTNQTAHRFFFVFVAVFLGCTSTGRVGLLFVVLCPGTPKGSTGSGSSFKASQKTGQRLKVSSDRLGETGNRTCDPWFTKHRFIPYTTAASHRFLYKSDCTLHRLQSDLYKKHQIIIFCSFLSLIHECLCLAYGKLSQFTSCTTFSTYLCLPLSCPECTSGIATSNVICLRLSNV